MKYGFMVDSSVYAPAYINATSITEAISKLENRLNVSGLSSKKTYGSFVDLWEHKGIERKDMTTKDLKELYVLYPSSTGKLMCNELCESIWKGLCREGEFTQNHFSALRSDMHGFPAGTQVNAIFDWLDKHYIGGIQELVYGNPYASYAEKPFVPCKYISVWDGFGEVESYAKYDPVNHEVYDVEIADLTVEELSECEILIGEYMELFGKRFSLEETENNDRRHVEGKDPINIVSGMKIYNPKKNTVSNSKSSLKALISDANTVKDIANDNITVRLPRREDREV